MRSLKSKDNLVWIDMEMTGLDPDKEKIIEIATIITDGELNVLEEGPALVVKQSKKLLDGMDAWNTNQHGKSGLTAEVLKSKLSLKQAEEQTIKFIKRYCYAKTATLCGNSIHHDRRFIARHMPKLHEFLHYRLIDVSTIKGLVVRWYSAQKLRKAPQKSEAHRAMQDIRESIEELRFFRKQYFKRVRK